MLNLVVPTVTIRLYSAIYNFQYDLMWKKLSNNSLLGTAQFLSILSSARLAAAAMIAVIPSSMPYITNLLSTDHMPDAVPKNEVDGSEIGFKEETALVQFSSPPAVLVTQVFKNFQAE
jgi:hypothetical protein